MLFVNIAKTVKYKNLWEETRTKCWAIFIEEIRKLTNVGIDLDMRHVRSPYHIYRNKKSTFSWLIKHHSHTKTRKIYNTYMNIFKEHTFLMYFCVVTD